MLLRTTLKLNPRIAIPRNAAPLSSSPFLPRCSQWLSPITHGRHPAFRWKCSSAKCEPGADAFRASQGSGTFSQLPPYLQLKLPLPLWSSKMKKLAYSPPHYKQTPPPLDDSSLRQRPPTFCPGFFFFAWGELKSTQLEAAGKFAPNAEGSPQSVHAFITHRVPPRKLIAPGYPTYSNLHTHANIANFSYSATLDRNASKVEYRGGQSLNSLTRGGTDPATVASTYLHVTPE